ncbi:carboxymuconolactone decarboxylase family protein [Gracilibacillus sp. YIM 98692]|uniref:carboxymuconolactone decarboxylase family protein n=1 Tax=Gracilibacillus sp. YIM 98692 TaxID=2663532 RepID=UPI0013D1C1E9|nr:carboxymuconolactone decarboxylase family protein [Gracilibacillus sp. YIM 98692]
MTNQNDNYKRGMDILKKITDEEGIDTIKSFGDFYPDFEKMMVSFGYGEIYARKELDLKQRELITLSSLITQGAFEQLDFHINAALRVGLEPKEIVELVTHCAAYAGFPKACTAMVKVMEVFKKQNIKLNDA